MGTDSLNNGPSGVIPQVKKKETGDNIQETLDNIQKISKLLPQNIADISNLVSGDQQQQLNKLLSTSNISQNQIDELLKNLLFLKSQGNSVNDFIETIVSYTEIDDFNREFKDEIYLPVKDESTKFLSNNSQKYIQEIDNGIKNDKLNSINDIDITSALDKDLETIVSNLDVNSNNKISSEISDKTTKLNDLLKIIPSGIALPDNLVQKQNEIKKFLESYNVLGNKLKEIEEKTVDQKQDTVDQKQDTVDQKQDTVDQKQEISKAIEILNSNNSFKDIIRGFETKYPKFIESIDKGGFNLKNDPKNTDQWIKFFTKSGVLKDPKIQEELLRLAFESDPNKDIKNVAGSDNVKAFRELFISSGIQESEVNTIIDKIQEKYNYVDKPNPIPDTAYFSPSTNGGQIIKDGYYLKYTTDGITQVIDKGEKPPTSYLEVLGDELMGNKDFKLNTGNKAYYEALDKYKTTSEEFNKVQTEFDNLTKTKNELTKNIENSNNKIKLLRNEQRLLERQPNSFENQKELAEIISEIKENEEIIKQKINDISKLDVNIKDLEKQKDSLQIAKNGIAQILTIERGNLEKNLENSKKTLNFLDSIGFTHIPMQDINWMIEQINIAPNYYGFDSKINLENLSSGSLTDKNLGYKQFIKFFNQLIGDNKNKPNIDQIEKYKSGNGDFNKGFSFKDSLDKSGVLYNGGLSKLNFYQKF